VNDNKFGKFYALGYTHNELEDLFKKISEGAYLTEQEYKDLIIAISLIDGLSEFDGTYDSLLNKPDILQTVRDANEFATQELLHERIAFSQRYIEAIVNKTLSDFKYEMDQNKADIDHKHDDRYSLWNHDHNGVYASYEELSSYVTKDYLEEVIAGLGSSGDNSGSIYPTYVNPTITVKANLSSIPHKKETTILLTPTYFQNDAGELIKFKIYKNSEIIHESDKVNSLTETIILKHGETATYSFEVEYGDGVIKNTTAGDPYPETSIKAGKIVCGISIKGQADSYVGVIPDREFEESDVANLITVKVSSKAYTYTYNLNEQKSVYMYPASYNELDSIKDANGFEYISSYTMSTIMYDDIEYYVYVLSEMTTIDKFKQVFS
jgi:hypothetical protein